MVCRQIKERSIVIGREKEVKELNRLYNGKRAELIAVYGRRRVCKTYLIDETLKEKLLFGMQGFLRMTKIRKVYCKLSLIIFNIHLSLPVWKLARNLKTGWMHFTC